VVLECGSRAPAFQSARKSYAAWGRRRVYAIQRNPKFRRRKIGGTKMRKRMSLGLVAVLAASSVFVIEWAVASGTTSPFRTGQSKCYGLPGTEVSCPDAEPTFGQNAVDNFAWAPSPAGDRVVRIEKNGTEKNGT